MALLICACNEKNEWAVPLELGVNSTRLNITQTGEGEFWFTVFASGSWNVSIIQGDEWLSCSSASESGTQELHFTYGENLEGNARIAKFKLVSASKEITVSVVQSGLSQTASSVEDVEL